MRRLDDCTQQKNRQMEFNILISVKFACTNILARILKFSLTYSVILDPDMHRKHGSSVVSGHSLVLEVPGSIPASSESEHAFSSVICRDDTR